MQTARNRREQAAEPPERGDIVDLKATGRTYSGQHGPTSARGTVACVDGLLLDDGRVCGNLASQVSRRRTSEKHAAARHDRPEECPPPSRALEPALRKSSSRIGDAEGATSASGPQSTAVCARIVSQGSRNGACKMITDQGSGTAPRTAEAGRESLHGRTFPTSADRQEKDGVQGRPWS